MSTFDIEIKCRLRFDEVCAKDSTVARNAVLRYLQNCEFTGLDIIDFDIYENTDDTRSED